MPTIRSVQPAHSRHLYGLKNGGLYFSFLNSAIFSKSSPTKTTIPPIEAAKGQPQYSEDEANAKITLKWIVCGSVVLAFGLINVAFGIYMIFQCWRKKYF
jgi:hypothetical protein